MLAAALMPYAWIESPAILLQGYTRLLTNRDSSCSIVTSPKQRLFSTGYRDSAGQLTVSASQTSAIVSILSAGTFFGALTAAPIAGLIGRKLGLILSTTVFILGVILQTAATAIPLFLAGRFFAGFGVGLISALVPLYQSETAPRWIRGVIVGAYQFSIADGLLLAATVNNAIKDRNDTGSYRIPIAVQFMWAIILIVGMLVFPETPRYLIKKGNFDGTRKSLASLRRLPHDDQAIIQEMAEIRANHESKLSLGDAIYWDCFKGRLLKRLLTGCCLQGLQPLTGINFIFYYGTYLFERSGFHNSFVITLITSCVAVGSTLPGLWAVELPTQKAAISFICIYIFFFAASWVVTGEIFPLKVRAKSLSMTTATNWLFSWALAYSTPYLVNYGPGNANLQSKIFFVSGGACLICIVFQVDELYSVMPRTEEGRPPFIDDYYLLAFSGQRSRQESVCGPGGET
ncbi:hypothetical protein V1517DRAFT_355507 [Lipomyces orientalis]|uniref:Uncharacterized protein n=1 Tax=Lipomyces orientalis TaxID=1233043 RepID=A0ACC3TD97_9ASCO